MKSSLIDDFFAERFPGLALDGPTYMMMAKRRGWQFVQQDFSYASYKLEGDSLIFGDMYVPQLQRGEGLAWQLHDKIIAIGRKAHKSVSICCSEKFGPKRILGLKTIKAFDFKPFMDLKDKTLFIKGI